MPHGTPLPSPAPGAPLPPHLLNSRSQPGALWRLFPGFCSLWDFLLGPSELAVPLKAKQKSGPTCFQFSGKSFAIKCLPAQLKGRAESAPPPFPREVGLCSPLPPLPQWALGPPRACAEGTHGCVPRAACLSWWSQAATTRGRTSLWCCSPSSTTSGSPS